MTGLNDHLGVSVYAEIGAKRCQDSGEGWVTTCSCSVNFKISELGHLTCVSFYFRKKTRSLQSQCTREDCICYISPVNFILKWLCSLKVAQCKCLLFPGSSLQGQLLAARRWELLCASHLHLIVLGEGAEGLLLGDVGPGRHSWVIPSCQFTSWIWGRFCLFSYTGRGLLLLRACMSNLGWCESAVGTYPGGWLWLLPPPLSGALGGTGLDRQVLSGLCVVLLLKGGVYMTRSSPSVCFSSLKSNPDSVWATWWIQATNAPRGRSWTKASLVQKHLNL